MNFIYNKQTCQNLREALRFEWLETNGLGDSASSTITGCNTRKYHGLFSASLDRPAGRYVLLSTLEESMVAGSSEFFFSCRQHPGCFYPEGHEYLQEACVGAWPKFRFRMGELFVTREILMPRKRRGVLIRYTLECPEGTPGVTLRIRPLLAYRSIHGLTRRNMDLRVWTYPEDGGFKIQPYDAMPPMIMQTDLPSEFLPSPDWYYNVQYLVERERGFPFEEDLFCPGVFEIPLKGGQSVLLSASLSPIKARELSPLWNEEIRRRERSDRTAHTVTGHLAREGEKFLLYDAQGAKSVVAGYPWFDAWGRDAMIALPGLTFYAGRTQEGVEILARAGQNMKDGLIPNVYGLDGVNSYNSADASLWYAWAVRQMQENAPQGLALVKRHCWQPLKEVIAAYSGGRVPHVSPDEAGLLDVGTPKTQLTWMDAQVNGTPVTPRNGFLVEINALWYNALVYANGLAQKFGESPVFPPEKLAVMKSEFTTRFWSEKRGFLADVWRPDGADWSFRPNQLFAASLPEPLLDREQSAAMVDQIRRRLLTPFGLRTLAPSEAAYRPLYEGDPSQRDSAYHQGTVWPWLLGAYCDALIASTLDPKRVLQDFLQDMTPLFVRHLRRYGIGSIAEIFDAAPPFRPNGCIAQAWSVAEVYRALKTVERKVPSVFARWETQLEKEAF
ncbi:MAG: amylo-alpha-1,6-glucosidase [Pyramidobacter sp.]|jgi:predicted glycogen debranching enzyme